MLVECNVWGEKIVPKQYLVSGATLTSSWSTLGSNSPSLDPMDAVYTTL